MLQFTYKLKIAERVKGKCNRHPRYNPEKDGRAGIRGACSCCFSLYDLYQAPVSLWMPHSANSFVGLCPGLAGANRDAQRPRVRPNHSYKFHQLLIIQAQTWSLDEVRKVVHVGRVA